MNETLNAGKIRLVRHSNEYWRVRFDLPPLNIFGPANIPQLEDIVSSMESDEAVKVVVFDSAVEGFFLTHYDFLAKLEDSTKYPAGPTGLQPLPDKVGAGLVPGGGPMARLPRLMGRGRALEVLLGADDINAELAELYGYVNRAFPDAELDGFVDALAMRIASFDKQAIAETKRLVDVASLPSDADIRPEWEAFLAALNRPAPGNRIKALMERGFHRPW